MKHFHISCVIILSYLVAMCASQLALAAQTQTQATHVQGVLNIAMPTTCAQVFSLTTPHALEAPGGRSTTSRQLDKQLNAVVTKLAQLAIAISQATTDGNFAGAAVLRRHLIERYQQAIAIGIDLSAYGELIKQIKIVANGELSERAGRQDQVRKQSKESERHLLPWVTLKTLSGHTDVVRSASFSPNGLRIVTASDDKTAIIWDAITGKKIATLSGHTDWVYAASFNPDGSRIVTASSDNTSLIWNAITGKAIATLTGHNGSVYSANFSPDGSRIVTGFGDGTARIWDAITGQSIGTLTGHSGGVRSANYSPDGLRIVTASSDGTARIWNAITGNPIVTFTGHTGNVYSANFSPDGLYVVTASSDNTALIWDAITGRPISILTGHTGLVHAANFSADGLRIVTASFDKTVRFWTQVEIENAGQTKSSSLNKDEIGKLR